MKTCIVTEDPLDARFMEGLLKSSEFKSPRIFTCQGNSSAESLAKSLLAVKQVPVAIILDANEHAPSMIEEYRQYMEAMLGMSAPRSSWEILLMVPEMETVFFQVPEMLKALGLPAPTAIESERAKYQPKQVLFDLINRTTGRSSPQSRKWLMDRLGKLPYDKVWQLKPFEDLQDFLKRHVAEVPTLGLP